MAKPNRTIRADAIGVFLKGTGSGDYRPGPISGYAHAYRMDDGGLSRGDRVYASHVAGAPLIRIHLPSGEKIYWASEDEHAREADRQARVAQARARGQSLDPLAGLIRPRSVRRP